MSMAAGLSRMLTSHKNGQVVCVTPGNAQATVDSGIDAAPQVPQQGRRYLTLIPKSAV